MKDTSRPHSSPSSRSAPYGKQRPSGGASSHRATRRVIDASRSQDQAGSRDPDRAQNSRRIDVHLRALSKTEGADNVRHTRKHGGTDGSARERLSQPNVLSAQADVPGPSLWLPLTSAPPGQGRAESPPPGSATASLHSIELPDKSSSAPPLETPFSILPPSLRLPPLSSTDSTTKASCTNRSDYQVGLVYKGYPFTYDLSALPDDPDGVIALLTIIKSDPGAYILVAAHYRRTGRPKAACAVIRSLLDHLNPDGLHGVERGKGDETSTTTADNSMVTLPAPGSRSGRRNEQTGSVFKAAAVRPALLLLAACELDISREYPDDPESDGHASTAHELFRAVYGGVNDSIVAEAERPRSRDALGLEFSSNRDRQSSASTEATSAARAKELEKDLTAARATQRTLEGKLAVSIGRLARAEDKVRTLESRSREMLARLDASRDENRELRQRLARYEQRAKEMAQCVPSPERVKCAPSPEIRVWGRLKELLFDNLGGGVRGE